MAQFQIPIPNRYLGCGYKGLGFCRNNGWVIENMDKAQGTHCTKMCADKLAENNPKCPKIYLPNLSAQAKKLGFQWKKVSMGVRSPWFSQTSSRLADHTCPYHLFFYWSPHDKHKLSLLCRLVFLPSLSLHLPNFPSHSRCLYQ